MEFETEDQQIEAIKKWFKDYGITIVTGLTLGLAGIFGLRYFLEQQELDLNVSSDSYEQVIVLLKEQSNREKFITEASAFAQTHGDSIYSNLLSFRLAKLAVDTDELGKAGQHLQDILDNPQHDTIEHIARVRLVRILISQNETDKALALIADVVGNGFRSSYEMLRGDIWFSKGDRNRAHQAYNAAKMHAEEGPTSPNLEMLLIELADAAANADVE